MLEKVNFAYLFFSVFFSSVAGWMLASLNIRKTARRSEVRQSCDKIETIFNEIIELSEKHYLKKERSAEFFELSSGQLVSLVEMRNTQIKNRIFKDFLKPEQLVKLRLLLTDDELDKDNDMQVDQKICAISETCWDMLESIEQTYTDHYTPTSFGKVSARIDPYLDVMTLVLFIFLGMGSLIILAWFFGPSQWFFS